MMARPNEEEFVHTSGEDEEMFEENLEQLRQEVEHLGQPNKTSTSRNQDNSASERDALLKDLDTIEPTVLRDYAERRIRELSRNSTFVGHRATANGDDTSPLGIFFRCPGKHGWSDDGYGYSCSVQEKTFKDVVPTASEAIGNLRFDSIFALARLISIYEHEQNEERRRFLMLDPKQVRISIAGVQKAYLFYKKHCDHVFRTLILHDGSLLCLAHDGGTGLPIEELNLVVNEAVRFAKGNEWDEIAHEEFAKVVMILPDSFRLINSAFKENPDLERRLYSKLSDIGGLLERSTARLCVLVGPTSDEPYPKREWCKVASALAAAARAGMKIMAVAPPRGDKAYMQNRADMNDTIDLAKAAAVLMKQGLISLIPAIESPQEPSHGPGAHPRGSNTQAYSREVISEYFAALRTYVKGTVDLPPLEAAVSSRCARVRNYFKQKKEALKRSRTPANPKPSRSTLRSIQCGAQAGPVMMGPHMYPTSVPLLPYHQWTFPSTSSSRGDHSRTRGHQSRRGYSHKTHRQPH